MMRMPAPTATPITHGCRPPDESSLDGGGDGAAATFTFVLMASTLSTAAAEGEGTSQDDATERARLIARRRAQMEQSRSRSDRQVYFDLSRQRAALYNTTYQGADCVPGIPCI